MAVLGALIGLISGILGIFVMQLVFYIQQMDSDVCDICDCKDDCLAWKKSRFGKTVYWNEWMMVTFIRLFRRCRYCKLPSKKQGIVLFFLFFTVCIFPIWSTGNYTNGIVYGITGTVLLFLSIIDWYTQYIPLECNLLIFLCGLIHLYSNFSNWLDYIIGLFAVSGFLLLIDRMSTPVLSKRYGEDMDQVIGDGDIKLMAATGLLLGWKLNFIALGIGCIMGSVIHLILMKIKGSEHRLAFGPYLSLGVYITMICGEQLVSWYLDFLGVKPL